MVGVPGRSKACNTCKLRKVACSLERPVCRTCTKAARECAGYQRERVFLLGPGTAYQGPTTTRIASSTKREREVSTRHKKVTRSLQKTQNDSSDNSLSPTTSIGNIQPLSSNAMYRQQILSEFLACTLPMSYASQQKHDINRNWLGMIPLVPEFTTALEASIMAVSTAKLGRVNSNLVLMREGLKFYVQGLWELQKALWDPNLMFRDETLAACMALIMYEVVECPEKTLYGWISHMKGSAKMFELKGPMAYDSDFGHQLFLSFRLLETQQALVEKRHTFLGESDWLTLPFKDRPKAMFQQLLDLVIKVANIIAGGYQMLQAPLEGTAPLDPRVMLVLVLGLVDQCWKADAELQEFFSSLETETLGPMYWPELSTEIQEIDPEPEIGRVFPVAFKFIHLRMAHMCTIYWATNCILWSGMAFTYQLLHSIAAAQTPKNDTSSGKFENHFDVSQLPPLGNRKDIASQAKNICQSVEYCLGDEHRGQGARAAVFPLKVAIETLNDARCERELLWAQAAMKRVYQTGVRIMKHVPGSLTDHAFLPG